MLILLSGDIILNPGPINCSQQYNNDQWTVFKKRDVHFVYINNNLLPKTDELQYITKLREAAVISNLESKLDDSVLSSEIQIENYDLIRSDRTDMVIVFACFIRDNLSYSTKSFLPSEIENIFITIFLPHSKLPIASTIYRPPGEGSFTETITEICLSIYLYLLGDFNINLFLK